MNDIRYNQLVEKLNSIMLFADGPKPSVSPAKSPGVGLAAPGLFITPDTNPEQLTENQPILAHVLLHKFYSTGCKNLTKQDIEELHCKIIKNLSFHSHFDRLDEKNDNQ